MEGGEVKMRKVKLLIVVLMTLFISGHSPKVHADKKGVKERAVWLWNTKLLLDESKDPLVFLENKQINKVYLQIDTELSNSVYQTFIEKAHSKGIQVAALDGDAYWTVDNGTHTLNKFLKWLEQYQQHATATQQFISIHLDIEPYTTPLWNENRMLAIENFQQLVLQAKGKALQLSIPLELDIAFWYDEVNYQTKYGSGILSNWTIHHSDSVTIMAYRDYSNGIIRSVKHEIAYAKRVGKKVVIGVETMKSAEGDQVSFYEEGEAYMNKHLKHIDNYYSNRRSFNGIAIHHFESWMGMKP